MLRGQKDTSSAKISLSTLLSLEKVDITIFFFILLFSSYRSNESSAVKEYQYFLSV